MSDINTTVDTIADRYAEALTDVREGDTMVSLEQFRAVLQDLGQMAAVVGAEAFDNDDREAILHSTGQAKILTVLLATVEITAMRLSLEGL
jgi:F0F1-type ATP synthase delta subunit